MLKIRDTDLVEALELLAAHRPDLNRRGLAMDLHRLKEGDDRSYLFLAHDTKSWLFSLAEVYEEGSYSNLCWLSPSVQLHGKPDTLLLQPRRAPKTRPRGNLTILDYSTMALDVEVFSLLTCPADREKHIQALLRDCRRQSVIGSRGEYLRYLEEKGGGTRGHGG